MKSNWVKTSRVRYVKIRPERGHPDVHYRVIAVNDATREVDLRGPAGQAMRIYAAHTYEDYETKRRSSLEAKENATKIGVKK